MLDTYPVNAASAELAEKATMKRLVLILIKPTQYGKGKFPYVSWRAIMPSNSLAALYSITLKALKHIMPEGIPVEIYALQENSKSHYDQLLQLLKRFPEDGTKLVVGFVGVQTAEFNRTCDLITKWQAVGATCVIGGFHVSGLLATMFDGVFDEKRPNIPRPHIMPTELQQLMDQGVILFKGEAEITWAKTLQDILEGHPEPLYRGASPDLKTAPIPQYPEGYFDNCVMTNTVTADTSRGCPFVCSFCSIINVHGRVSRPRDPQMILQWVEELCCGIGQEMVHIFFTDDNIARSPGRDELLDGLIARRKQGYNFSFMVQVDLASHTIPGFFAKLAAAGCTQVFMGVETMNPANLKQVGKGQNKVASYQPAWEELHSLGILVQTAFMIGFDADTQASVEQDVQQLADNGADIPAFFIISPAPGSVDHVNAFVEGKWMDPDWDLYDTFHPVVEHPRMTREQWLQAYLSAWKAFFSTENMIRALKRHSSRQVRLGLLRNFIWYRWSAFTEGTHPFIAGAYHYRFLNDRRSGAPAIPVWKFLCQELWRHLRYGGRFLAEFYRFQQVIFETELSPAWATKKAQASDRAHSLNDWLRFTFGKRPSRRWLNAFWLEYGQAKWRLLWHPKAIVKHPLVPFVAFSEVVYTIRFAVMLPKLVRVNPN